MVCDKILDYAIGIDPGTQTGFAIWDINRSQFFTIKSGQIISIIEELKDFIINNPDSNIIVRIEDARQRIWFGNAGKERLQGAGSIKRDCKIWEEYLSSKGISFELIPPKKIITKVSSEYFIKLSGWAGRTNNHARDAAMLVLNYKKGVIKIS